MWFYPEMIILDSVLNTSLKSEKMRIEEIKEKVIPILQKHEVVRAGLFGSMAKGASTEKSDIDILVELGNKISLLEFVGIKLELEDLLGQKVDLVEYAAIKPGLKERILAEEIKIYG